MVMKLSEIQKNRRVVWTDFHEMTKMEFGYKQKVSESATEEVWKFIVWGKNTIGVQKHSKMDRIIFVLGGRASVRLGKDTPAFLTAGQAMPLPHGVEYNIGSMDEETQFLFIQPVGYDAKLKEVSPPAIDVSADDKLRVQGSFIPKERRILTSVEREERAKKIERLKTRPPVQENAASQKRNASNNPQLQKDIEDFYKSERLPKVEVDLTQPAPVAEEDAKPVKRLDLSKKKNTPAKAKDDYSVPVIAEAEEPKKAEEESSVDVFSEDF